MKMLDNLSPMAGIRAKGAISRSIPNHENVRAPAKVFLATPALTQSQYFSRRKWRQLFLRLEYPIQSRWKDGQKLLVLDLDSAIIPSHQERHRKCIGGGDRDQGFLLIDRHRKAKWKMNRTCLRRPSGPIMVNDPSQSVRHGSPGLRPMSSMNQVCKAIGAPPALWYGDMCKMASFYDPDGSLESGTDSVTQEPVLRASGRSPSEPAWGLEDAR